MTVGAKNNYARAIKLDLTFFSFGFYIFEVFSGLLSSRRRLQDVQTETIRSERVKVIPLKLFYYQTFFETWHNEHS